MSVKFQLLRNNGGIARNESRAPCFGSLSGMQSSTGTRMSESFRLSHVTYWPAVWQEERLTEDEIRDWYEYLLSLPVVQDSVKGHTSLEEDVSGDDWSVAVRADIPSDRMLNILALFRYAFVGTAAVQNFLEMVEADVHPKVAFTLAVGCFDHNSFTERRIRPGLDTEHAFVDQAFFGMEDAKRMVEVFQGGGWRSSYEGLQDLYSQTGTYRRGNVDNGASERMTAFTGPSRATGDAYKVKDLCLPFLAVRAIRPALADTNRRQGRGLSSYRGEALRVSPSEMMEIVGWFEEKLHAI